MGMIFQAIFVTEDDFFDNFFGAEGSHRVCDISYNSDNPTSFVSFTDNTTRTKIGKVVLQPKPDGKEGVQIKSYLNQTYG